MALSILAALLHGIGYLIYLCQVYGGGSVPNPASWTVWALLSILNALTFWKASKDPLATAQFFTGSVLCVAVWVYALASGRFSPLDTMGWAVLASCIITSIIWWATRSAIYASLMVAGILFWSSVPTIQGVWQNSSLEQALPWYLWTAAYLVTSINVARRRDQNNSRWWLLMAVPIVGIIIHGMVAIAVR